MKGADITFMKDNKSLLMLVCELERSHERSGDAQKIRYYKHIRNWLETILNSSVLLDIGKLDMGRLQALAKAGADFYQNGQVLMTLVNTAGMKPEIATFVLNSHPENDRYIVAVQTNGSTIAGYLISVANGKNNEEVAKVIKNRVNGIFARDASAGNLPRVQALLKLSGVIDLTHKGSGGNTALAMAVQNRRVEIVSCLLEAGADPSVRNSANKTARDLCGNDVRIASILDKVGLTNELRSKIKENGESLTPTDLASYLDKGVQVNSTDTGGNTILSMAIRFKCSTDVLTNLITTYHADPNLLNRNRTGPVETALFYRDAATLKCLFEAGVNIKRGRNKLLEYAQEHGFEGSVDLIKEELGNLLWKAVDDENVEEIKEMLANCGAYVDAISHKEGYEGWTTLFLAAHKNNVEVVKLLCTSQANVDIRSEDGKTAISVAAETGRKDVLLYLVSEGASVNIPDLHGNTPLSIAVKAGYLPTVQILLHAGANPYHELGGNAIAELAARSPNKNIVYIFEHLDFTTALPDWVEDTTPPNNKANKAVHTFCLPPVKFNTAAPPQKAFVLRGDEKTNKKLLDSVKNLKANKVKEAVAEGADIRYYDKNGKRVLQHAQEKLEKIQKEPKHLNSDRRTSQIMEENVAKDIVQFLTSKLNESIWDAVKGEDLERVQTFHSCGAPLNWCSPQQPLGLPGLLVCSQDSPEILTYLLYNCAENVPTLRKTDGQGQTLLTLAQKSGFKNTGSWIRAKLTFNLNLALTNKDLAAAKQILQFGACPELDRADGETHLHQAVETGDLGLVQMLLNAGADPETKYQRNSLIDLSRMKGLHQISRLLTTSLSTKKLFSAAGAGDLDSVQEHHTAGGHIDGNSYEKITPLKLAKDAGKSQLIHYLTSRGASLVRSTTFADPIGQLENLSYNPPLKSYIQRSVDEQFLTTVIEGDTDKLENLLQLGADIKYSNPNSSETAISLCINYHSVELLKFLEKRGAILTSPADGKGNYALGIAASRGNTAVVEYLLHEININKGIINKEGKTPLDLAQATDHQEVVRLLGGEVKEDKNKKGQKPPKYKLDELLEAVKKCNMDIISEFIEEVYSRRDLKVRHCVEMWRCSQREKQKEVERKLAKHYQELIEDTSEHKLTGTAESQVILTGFLRSLSSQITGYALDPNDPRSYDIFFKNMDEKAEEARQRIMIDDLQQLKNQFQEDLVKVQEELAGLRQQRENMQARDREYYERIAQMQIQLSEEKSARERDRIRQEMVSMQDDLKTLHAQQKILEDQEKRQLNHVNVSKRFEATSFNLLLFYRTIYLGVEEIFLGAKAIASGMAASTKGSLGKKAAKLSFVSGAILGVFSLDPLVGSTVAKLAKFAVKASVKAMQAVDKYRQREIGQYISCLATVGEQTDICTDVAYRLTLWYSEQIQCLVEPNDTSKTSICIHAPARRMAQLAVGVMYSALHEQKIEKEKVSELPTLAEKLAWCVVAQKPSDGIMSKLQERATEAAAALKKKVGKGETGTGYMASKIPPNFIEIEVAEEHQIKGRKTWMLRDIFLKTGIIDKQGNVFEGKDCDVEVYKYCYGTESVAVERGLKLLQDKTITPKEGMFVEEDVLVVTSVGQGGGGGGGQFHLAPGKIDERVQKILKEENLNRDKMEKKWKEDIRELENEVSTRTREHEKGMSFLEAEVRDKIPKIEELAEEKRKEHEETFNKYQGQLLGKYNELKSKMEAEFNTIFKKMQADTRKEFDVMQKKFAKKENELDLAFEKSQAKLNDHYAETEKRLEAETKANIKRMDGKLNDFCAETNKNIVEKFKFSKDQVDMFIDHQKKDLKRLETETTVLLEAKVDNHKKDLDQQTNVVRESLINLVESRTKKYHDGIKSLCDDNKKDMKELVVALQKKVDELEVKVSNIQFQDDAVRYVKPQK